MKMRIFLRPFNLDDAPTLLRWGQDKYYQHWAGFPHYRNLPEAEVAAGQYAARKNSYAVCLQSDGQMIGLVELYDRGVADDVLLNSKEVGFLLEQDFSGHGYMTEALNLLINYAFNDLKQLEIWAGTLKTNLPAQRLLQHFDFKYIYSVDLGALSHLLAGEERYFCLKKADWVKRTQKD